MKRKTIIPVQMANKAACATRLDIAGETLAAVLQAATSALNLEKYRLLFDRVHELNAIAIEELQHFELVLGLLRRRGIPF